MEVLLTECIPQGRVLLGCFFHVLMQQHVSIVGHFVVRSAAGFDWKSNVRNNLQTCHPKIPFATKFIYMIRCL